MSDTTLPVTEADGNKVDVAFDVDNNVYTPITYARQYAGTAWSVSQSGPWSVSITGTVTVDTHAVTQSGTWNIGTVTGGSIAHDAADSGNPLKIGAKAVSTLNSQTMVAANDRTNVFADLDGALLTRSDGAVGDRVNGTASTTGTSDTSVLAAGGSGIKHHITDVTIANTSDNDITVALKDGSTTKWVFPVPAKGGVTHAFRTPLSGTANTAWNFAASSASTTVYCSVSGYKSKL